MMLMNTVGAPIPDMVIEFDAGQYMTYDVVPGQTLSGSIDISKPRYQPCIISLAAWGSVDIPYIIDNVKTNQASTKKIPIELMYVYSPWSGWWASGMSYVSVTNFYGYSYGVSSDGIGLQNRDFADTTATIQWDSLNFSISVAFGSSYIVPTEEYGIPNWALSVNGIVVEESN